jgi:rRNA maturation endonuclease Nob1
VQLAAHLAVMVLAILLLRLGLQLALLHEAHDEIQAEQPILCPQCNHVVPDMAFCPNCGAAMRASSRSSRVWRRSERPTLNSPETP